MISMDLSKFSLQRSDFSNFDPKSAEKCVSEHFFVPKRSFSHFSLQNAKNWHGPETLLQTMLFQLFWEPFSQKDVKGRNFSILPVFTTFGGQKLLLRPKSEKEQKWVKDEKSCFPLRAPNSEKHKHLGTFLEPKTPKIAFSTFGQTFPFWSVSGAKSAPEAKNQDISGFFVPKVIKQRFCDSGRKRVPKTLRL